MPPVLTMRLTSTIHVARMPITIKAITPAVRADRPNRQEKMYQPPARTSETAQVRFARAI